MVALFNSLWYETRGSLGLPFDLNQSLSFLGLFNLSGACVPLGRMCFDVPLFYKIFACFDMTFISELFADSYRQVQLVS